MSPDVTLIVFACFGVLLYLISNYQRRADRNHDLHIFREAFSAYREAVQYAFYAATGALDDDEEDTGSSGDSDDDD